MASIRRGYSDDFTLNNNPSGFRKVASSSVGIGTSVGQEVLDVVDGAVKGQDLKVTGVSSFTAYEGFLRANHQIAENTTLSFDQGPSASLSGEIIVGTGQTVTVNTVQDDPLGPELITNGNFDSDVSGWIAGTDTAVALDGGRIKITNSAAVYGSAYQDITVVPGETYVINMHYAGGTGSGNYHVGDAVTTNKYLSAASGKRAFTPKGETTVRVVLNVGGNTSGHYVLFDSITVKKENNVSDKTTRAGGSEIECLKVFNTFTPPSGGTNDRPYAPKPGELYYNYDLKTIEFFDGNGWRQVDNTTRSGRGVFAGGNDVPNRINIIDYVSIQTFGNSIDFGDLISQRQAPSGGSDGTRGLALGGYVGSGSNEIDYITIASGGNGIDFGNLTAARWYTASVSSSTRCVTSGGSTALTTIDYVEIATTGDSLSFGTLAQNLNEVTGCQSPTRGFFLKHATAPTTIRSVYITIASKGNGTLWDELTTDANQGHSALSNSVQAFVAGGDRNDGLNTKHIDTFNMSSLGAAYQFGELTTTGSNEGRSYMAPVNNSTRGLFAGGNTPAAENRIDYITLTTAGNAQDFGDLSHARGGGPAGISDSHGGLGGF
jgi:hypothetical protein